MFNKRAQELLNILISTENAVTGSKLAEQLHVSNRTIRSDIQQINALLSVEQAEVKSSNPYGYYVEENDKTLIRLMLEEERSESKDYIPNTPSQRLTFLLMKLLFSDTEISMNQIADEIFVSKATVNGDVKRLIQYLKEKGESIQVSSNTNGLVLMGKELDKRIVLLNYLCFKENGLDLLYKNLEFINAGESINEKAIHLYQDIITLIEKHSIYLTDKVVHTLVIYIVIATNRIKQKHEIDPLEKHSKSMNIVMEIAKKASELFQVGFNVDEIAVIQQRIEGKRLAKANATLMKDDEVTKIITNFLWEVKIRYGFDFTRNESLRKFLYLHITPMLYRLRNNEVEDNPLKDDIKKKYPLATEVSMVLFNVIKEKMNLFMNDSEISYIALHIAAAMEVLLTPARILIVSDLGAGAVQLLITKLSNHFSNKIQIMDSLTLYQLQSKIQKDTLENCDLIITTSSLYMELTLPIVKVNPLLIIEDIRNIKHYIHYYSTEIKDKDKFFELFDKDLFMIVKEQTNYYDVIAQLVKRLLIKGYIDDEDKYYQLVLDREEAYSTIMDNHIAIPHASENIAKKTTIATAILKYPVEQDGKKVEIVLLNAMNEKEDLQNLYVAIEKMLEIKNIDKLLKSSNYEEFMNHLTMK